jgi:flagellar FliJ protein
MLKIRRQREDERKRVVAARLREIARVQDRIRSIAVQTEQEVRAMRVAQASGRIDLQLAMRRRHWLGHLHKTKLETEAHRRVLEAKLAQERAVLAEAAKERRILEKLKERQWENYRSQQERIEIKTADEMATQRYVYDRRESLQLVEA